MVSEIVPDTSDGWCVSHQFFSVDWRALSQLNHSVRSEAATELRSALLKHQEVSPDGQSAMFHVLGHKASLLVLHFAKSFAQVAERELEINKLRLNEFLTPTYSFLSVVELGMYHLTKKAHEQLTERGLQLHTKEWQEEYSKFIEPHRQNLHERAFCAMPSSNYICFYPMNKKRGEQFNWYAEGIGKRAELMMEHGMTGRRYAGKVNQIISGSIGLDDWEWGVDLFADDPTVFKQLVYEMRFDEATSRYGDFGAFYLGMRVPGDKITEYINGRLPFS